MVERWREPPERRDDDRPGPTSGNGGAVVGREMVRGGELGHGEMAELWYDEKCELGTGSIAVRKVILYNTMIKK